ncbi:hypothetical protein FDI24_gp162 [Acidovorax phage ACP17]|uniref:Uncharacterized protein n=1 Tax=Acidovorax phage ACP17 TaxID=2010329 RepID=A0A218M328_9CAUD|nr:hypothetical protein FDI24_gp162 [Acidovorax phage ACP17]ASD50444.1 hypothetical protein [Acidovorax phage ACP17]
MLTLNQINKELARRGYEERIAKGKGYFYFFGGTCPTWIKTCVWVDTLNTYSMTEWLTQYFMLKQTWDSFPQADF